MNLLNNANRRLDNAYSSRRWVTFEDDALNDKR